MHKKRTRHARAHTCISRRSSFAETPHPLALHQASGRRSHPLRRSSSSCCCCGDLCWCCSRCRPQRNSPPHRSHNVADHGVMTSLSLRGAPHKQGGQQRWCVKKGPPICPERVVVCLPRSDKERVRGESREFSKLQLYDQRGGAGDAGNNM